MDETRFDTLTRTLSTAGSRRRALGGLLLGSLGLAGWPVGEDAAAHDLKAKCKKKSGEAKKKCLKKAKQHNAQHAAETSPPPPPPPPPHVCAGREFCTTPDEQNLCQTTSDQECECMVTAAGAPFCAATRPRGYFVGTCGACKQGETCIDLAACGAGAPAPFACVHPCPNGPTCNDGIQNGSETDVDCGGPACPRCELGQRCLTNTDCVLSQCYNGQCVD